MEESSRTCPPEIMEKLFDLVSRLMPTDAQLVTQAFKDKSFWNYLCEEHKTKVKKIKKLTTPFILVGCMLCIGLMMLAASSGFYALRLSALFGILFCSPLFVVWFFDCYLAKTCQLKKIKACSYCLENITLCARNNDERSQLVGQVFLPYVFTFMMSKLWINVVGEDGLSAILLSALAFENYLADCFEYSCYCILEKNEMFKATELVEEFFALVANKVPGFSLVAKPNWSPCLCYKEEFIPKIQT